MTAPQKSESPVGAGLTREQGKKDNQHCAKAPGMACELGVIEGERRAHECFCAAVTKALRGGAA